MTKPAPSPEDDPYADRRVYPRVPVALPAFLQAGGIRHHVHLLDLSAGGAKLTCPVQLPSGTAVILDCGIIGRAATVRWQNGATLGLAFDVQLDALDVAALTARSAALAAWMKHD